MKIKSSTLFLLTIILSCSSPKEKSLKNIKAMENNDSIFSPSTIEEMKTAYLDFATKYPDDELTPEFIFKAAQRCNATAKHDEAIQLLQNIIDKYPKNKLCEEALFLQGYIYENSMHNYNKAVDVYANFILKYPTSDLAEDAKYSIENMGKSPEEIFESFKNKKDSVS